MLDGGPGGHSVFTGRLIQALENVEDYITARELGQYLKKQVYADAAARGHTQRPVDGEIYGTGDFVFVPDMEKKEREIDAEVDSLEAELLRLKRLKEEASQSKDQAKEREIERQRLIKDAELKQAQIRKNEKEELAKRQRQAAIEAEQLEKGRKEREAENEKRLAMLRIQADKMRQELGENISTGATLESAVAELRKIQETIEKIQGEFSAELERQSQSLTAFYDKKIRVITDIPFRDKEFETEEDYQVRLAEADRKATPLILAKREKLTSLTHDLEKVRDDQISPLKSQMKILKEKRFIIPVSQVSFDFLTYCLKPQIMLGTLSTNGTEERFVVNISKDKARLYKYHPELLIPEVHMKATLAGPKLNKAIFHAPENVETYEALPGVAVSEDGRFIDNGDETVTDTKTNLMWAAKDNGKGITWLDAKAYCENCRVAGYDDWRMPTQDELASLFDPASQNRSGFHVTPFIDISSCCPWALERRESMGAYFSFSSGHKDWNHESGLNYGFARALPVRSCDPLIAGGKALKAKAKDEVGHLKGYKVGDTPERSQNVERQPPPSNVICHEGVYVVYANGIVRDAEAGLEWIAAPHESMSSDRGKVWVKNLMIDAGGWRLPTSDEMMRLYKNASGTEKIASILKLSGYLACPTEAGEGMLFRKIDKLGVWHFSNIGQVYAVRSRSDR